ncbi:hypothetical protein [Mycolicibacterium arenosum]|uniref:Uncharacterized protein n=1 Tax=Mycolicibacterium arenosum TaxID=2952157 RepID=A0ABT1M316_9MYCO|nr:hypothetical protein [Mycolicibacterium sp. CAU 1645]MCP9273550.1 hypothetical protein [Mycolicibacterium sp. CAU 1645]
MADSVVAWAGGGWTAGGVSTGVDGLCGVPGVVAGVVSTGSGSCSAGADISGIGGAVTSVCWPSSLVEVSDAPELE